MSRSGFAPAKKEVVPTGSVWEYLPIHIRHGRFQVKAFCPKRLGVVGAVDLYEVAEVQRGEVRKYTEDDILSIAKMTDIQPGSNWLDGANSLCKIERPEFGSGALENSWIFSFVSVLATWHGASSVRESDILRYWKPVKGGASCPLCGGPGLQLFTSFECAVSSCRNARRGG